MWYQDSGLAGSEGLVLFLDVDVLSLLEVAEVLGLVLVFFLELLELVERCPIVALQHVEPGRADVSVDLALLLDPMELVLE